MPCHTPGMSQPKGVSPWSALGRAAVCGLLLTLVPPSAASGAAGAPAAAARPAGQVRATERWGEEQGVPGIVTALLRSQDGYLWVGTRRGLVRFDGLRFSRVPVSDGAPELNVRALLEDRAGAIWIASDGGLGRLSGGGYAPVGPAGGPVFSLLLGKGGALFAGTSAGLARVLPDRLQPVAPCPAPVMVLAEDRDGRLLAGGEAGLWALEGDRLVRPAAADGGTTRAVRSLLTDRRGRTWVGTVEGLVRADRAGAAEGRSVGAGLESTAVTSLAEDLDGRVWAGTVSGGVHLLSEDGAAAAREPGLPTRPVNALISDRDGSVWSGSGGGLVRLRPRLLPPVTGQDPGSTEVVWSVYADPVDGALWLGVDGHGVRRLSGGRVTSDAGRWGLAGSTVSAALRTSDGDLWLSVRSAGVLRVRGDEVEPVRDADGAPYERVRGLFQATDGGVWLGTERGLERHAGGRAARVPVATGWPFRVVAEDRAGRVWAGGAALRLLEGPAWQDRTPPGLEAVRHVMSLLPDGDSLWIASYQAGLQLWHRGRVITFGDLDRRLAGRAVAVLLDGHDGLWLALEGALVRASRDELLAAAEGRGGALRLQAFDERDGMPSTEFTAAGQSPAARTPDGRLWFGTVAGLVMVDPERLAALGAPSAPQVERAFVGGAEVTLGGGALRLAHGDATLELHFTSPTLVSPHQVLFRHRLVGHEQGWQASGAQRTATYRGLGEGDYRFELEASRDGAEWVPLAAPLAVEVRPGPLERTWVRALLLALGAAALAAAVAGWQRLRSRRLREQARELAGLVEARTRELAAARDELEARVEERTAQLQRELAERERLERQLADAQKLDSIGRLAGGVAHDLNNLLTVVLGCASTAQLPEATPAEVQADLREIQQAGERAAALTRQLLAFARRQILASRRLDLNDVVTGVGAMLRRLIGADVELVTALAAAPCPVLADPGQLEQVLVNLAINARDAMPGGGTLRLETATVHLAQDLDGARPGVAAGAWVRLRVVDSGTGLSEEAARHLFEPFFTTKEKGKGTGLGLATCYGIVKQMGGHIWLDSEAGRGTAVEIHLPYSEGRLERPSGDAEAARAPRGGGERVLVVEDEPQVRALAARALADRGYQVLTAGDGEAALALLAREPPVDLVLTDVVMPHMGGVDLAARLRERDPAPAVLFMSGYVDRASLGRSVLPEDAPFQLKPFTPAALATKVREVLDARAGGPEAAAR